MTRRPLQMEAAMVERLERLRYEGHAISKDGCLVRWRRNGESNMIHDWKDRDATIALRLFGCGCTIAEIAYGFTVSVDAVERLIRETLKRQDKKL